MKKKRDVWKWLCPQRDSSAALSEASACSVFQHQAKCCIFSPLRHQSEGPPQWGAAVAVAAWLLFDQWMWRDDSTIGIACTETTALTLFLPTSHFPFLRRFSLKAIKRPTSRPREEESRTTGAEIKVTAEKHVASRHLLSPDRLISCAAAVACYRLLSSSFFLTSEWREAGVLWKEKARCVLC